MCRWFTYLGHESQLLEDVLLRPSHSIIKQSEFILLPFGRANRSQSTNISFPLGT